MTQQAELRVPPSRDRLREPRRDALVELRVERGNDEVAREVLSEKGVVRVRGRRDERRPPAEAEANYYAALDEVPLAA